MGKIDALIASSKKTLTRFPFAFAMLAASVMAQVALIAITTGDNSFNVDDGTISLFANMIFFTYISYMGYVALTLVREKKNLNDTKTFIGYIVLTLVTLLLTFFYFPKTGDLDYGPMQWYRIIVIFFTFALSIYILPVFLHKEEDDDTYWNTSSELLRSGFISFLFSSILYLGLNIAILAAQFLLSIDVHPSIWGYTFVLTYNVFGSILFLSGIPSDLKITFDKDKYSKARYILNKFVIIPLVTLYTVILYMFILRITFAGDIPANQSVPFVTVFALFGFYGAYTLYPLQDKEGYGWVKKYLKGFSISAIPLMLLYFYGIIVRVSEYGFTIDRVYTITLGLIFVYFIAQLLFRKQLPLRYIVLSVTSVFVLVTFTPFLNAGTLSSNSQAGRFKDILEETGVLDSDGKVDTSKTLKNEAELYDIFEYLGRNHGYSNLRELFTDSQWDKLDWEDTSRYSSYYHWETFLDFFEDVEDAKYPDPIMDEDEYFSLSTEGNNFTKVEGSKALVFSISAGRYYNTYTDVNEYGIESIAFNTTNDAIIVEVNNDEELEIPISIDDILKDSGSINYYVDTDDLKFTKTANDGIIDRVDVQLSNVSGYVDADTDESSITGLSGTLIVYLK